MAHTEPSEKRGSGEEIHPLPSRSLSARFRRNSPFLQDVFPPFCYTSAYAEKGGTADLFYEIRHNVDGGLAALVVDYLELKPEQQPDGMWKVSVPAPDQAGVHSFALSQAVFDDGTQADAEDRIRMEILKDVPSVENFVWDKTALDELKIRFDLKDEDSALQDAWVKIEEEGGNVLLEETISVGENEVSAALTLKEDYVITVTADYDRDTNAMDDQSNGYSGEVLLAQTVSVSRDALELKDITAQRLFYTGGNGREEVSVLDITGGLPTDPENYYALIEIPVYFRCDVAILDEE